MNDSILIQSTPASDAPFIQRPEALGLPFVLTLIYLWVEYARPANPMKIPLIVSVLLLMNWTMHRDKIWNPQANCFLMLLALIAITGPFAVNTYAAWWGFVA